MPRGQGPRWVKRQSMAKCCFSASERLWYCSPAAWAGHLAVEFPVGMVLTAGAVGALARMNHDVCHGRASESCAVGSEVVIGKILALILRCPLRGVAWPPASPESHSPPTPAGPPTRGLSL